jgi:hypothetical protein
MRQHCHARGNSPIGMFDLRNSVHSNDCSVDARKKLRAFWSKNEHACRNVSKNGESSGRKKLEK